MTLSTGFKRTALSTNQRRYLPSPTKPHNSPTLNLGILIFHVLQQRKNQWQGPVRIRGTGHEIVDGFDLRGRFGWEVGEVLRIVAEEVWHEDFEVPGIVRVGRVVGGEDVGAADCLDVKAEDIVADEDAAFGCFGATYIWWDSQMDKKKAGIEVSRLAWHPHVLNPLNSV